MNQLCVPASLEGKENHSLYLPPHGQAKEDEEIHQQDRPVDGYIEYSGGRGEERKQ